MMLMLLTACATSSLDRAVQSKATDSAACELAEPIDEAVEITLEYAESTPAPVINSWRVVTQGFDGLNCPN